MTDPVSQFKTWYEKQPLFTRTFLTGTFLCSVLYSFGLLNPAYLYFDLESAIFKLQLWRLITCMLFMGKFSFNLIISMYFAYFAISRVQTTEFTKREYADFLFLVLYSWVFLLLLAMPLNMYFLSDSFAFVMLYIWCKRKPYEIITFFFGLQVKSGYFPWVYMGFNVLMGQSFMGYVAGLIVAHTYVFIKDVYKTKVNKDYLATPRFFENFVKTYIVKQAPRVQNQQRPQGFGIFGGQGVRIG